MLIVSVLALAGCSSPVPVTGTDRDRVERFVRKQQEPLPVRFEAMWYSNGEPPMMICGEIEAPGRLRQERERLRYMFFLNTPKPDGAIELHEMVVAGDRRGEQILAEGRRVFDRTWGVACATTAPWSIARWWRGTETASDGGTDTPLTNGYIEGLLERSR
ncbi:hypothetical protein ASE73_02610 [Sphingomonas sp. Leaf24]|uniref:hypothetical protein n=1 Tax=Sphingomonas sp. Leaf24 TaxID=1735690 RepID=UPI0006F71E06|nr:hypothetical protein [Sphingomonas sp. Leaf24]KQM23135.1 hypothetical protein ASE50_02610 [Sphingomonas sp. Leaf5]KQM95993.1 hypothetical protein ASE73_02610 [Sphingomonas sp. Leaf24]